MRNRGWLPFQVLSCAVLAAAWVTAVVAFSGSGDSAPPGVEAAAAAAVTTAVQQPATPPSGMKLPPTPEKQVGATYVGDDTCLTCHEDQKKGYASTMHGRSDHSRAPAAKMGCETCHGPGSKHVAEPDNAEFLKAIALTPEHADKGGLCLRCHDADNDPHYSFPERYAMIAHKGLDKYDDPEVHQGLDPKALEALRGPAAD